MVSQLKTIEGQGEGEKQSKSSIKTEVISQEKNRHST